MGIEVEARIYLEDAGQIVYHAAYLKFMERERTELLSAVGCEQSATYGGERSQSALNPKSKLQVILSSCETTLV